MGEISDFDKVKDVDKKFKQVVGEQVAGWLDSDSELDWAKAMPALTEALKDEDEEVRWFTALFLGGISVAKEPALIKALDGVMPALCKAMDDEDAKVRAAAASTIGEIGVAGSFRGNRNFLNRAMSAIMGHLDDEDEVSTLMVIYKLSAVPLYILGNRRLRRSLRI